ncbi:transcriptional regulator [Oceaniferula spumae]|uniref:Transcriptional regulator n=1 Tax=Oceaniferula spumae TaxID=2979115 RepID=A0AAT9FSK8_9BACT
MPAIHASKEIIIEKPVSEVYAYVRDFETWPKWSPWLICEPETKLSFQKDAYSWEGKFVGAGMMRVADAKENRQIDYHLEFLKPWKSKAAVSMEFSELGDGTRVRWVMNSSLPWFMFFMKPMMECMIGMDYERGLRMLKERLETGTLRSALSYEARVTIPACDYIGIERICAMEDMERLMGEDFEKIGTIPEELIAQDEPVFTIYNAWKLSKGQASYIACCPVKTAPSQAPGGMMIGRRPACEAFTVDHKGSYNHLGNAWAAGMMRGQAKLFKQDKKVPPFEQYLNDPHETAEADLLTRVCLPRKD